MEPQSIGKMVGSGARGEEGAAGPSRSPGAARASSARAKKKKPNARSPGSVEAPGGPRPRDGGRESDGGQEVTGLRLQVERLQEMVQRLHQRLDRHESRLAQAAPGPRDDAGPTSARAGEACEEDGSAVSPGGHRALEPLVLEAVPADAERDAGGLYGKYSTESPAVAQAVSRRFILQRNMTAGHFDQLVDNQVGWEETVWDISFFVGLKELGVAGSAFTLLLLILNVFIQYVFISIIESSFTTSSFSDDTIAAYKKWRLNSGHDASHLDSSFVSLVGRLCSGDESLEMSGQQASALALIQSYLPTDETKHLALFGGQVGPVLCVLCIFIWVLTTSAEMQRIVSQCRALVMLPRTSGIQSGTVLRQKPNGGWTLVSLCPGRIGIFFMVQLFRTGIAIRLTEAGIRYLVYATDLKDLVLNAVALQFVLTVDELLTQALAPTQAVKFVRLLDAMPGPKRMQWRGLDARTVCTYVGIVIVVAAVVPLWLAPEISRLEQARDALCAGDTQFVTIPSTYPPYTWWAKSVAPGTETISRDASGVWGDAEKDVSYDYRSSHRMTAKIIQADVGDAMADAMNPSIVGSPWSLRAMQSWGVAEGANRFNFQCEDGASYGDVGNAPVWYRSALADWFGATIHNCMEASVFCHNDTAAGVAARSWCPVTCGCRSPSSDLILKDAESGCPDACREHPSYVAELANASCEERAPEIITQASDWQTYVAKLELAATDWTPGGRAFAQSIRAAMSTYGCGAVAFLKDTLNFDVCREGRTYKPIPMKTLRFMCPRTCNCTMDMFDCPSSISC